MQFWNQIQLDVNDEIFLFDPKLNLNIVSEPSALENVFFFNSFGTRMK